MDDVAMLPEEVREAVAYMDGAGVAVVAVGAWHTIRAELLRLARDNSDLRFRITNSGMCELAADNDALAEYMRHWESRAERAEAENAELRKAGNRALASIDRLNEILKSAESERDALRKRLKNSLVEVTYTSEIGYVVNGDERLLDAACVADCAALVPLDDAEAKG